MKTSTIYVQRFRVRKKEGRLLLPRIEIENTIADDLVDTGWLEEWDAEAPQAIAEAIVKLLKSLRNDISESE